MKYIKQELRIEMKKRIKKGKTFLEKISLELFITIFIMAIIMIGMTSNFIVITQNQGRMPVFTHYYINTTQHFSFQDKSEVNQFILSDIIKITFKNYYNYFSIGDILLYGGFFAIFVVFFSIGKKYYGGNYDRSRRN